jgi:outer membrane protein OmpA-like peptidoglycan-associated protein
VIKTEEQELKDLLLGTELDLLATLDERCAVLEGRLGDEGALSQSVGAIIVDVLREAGVKDHEKLAGVIAPVVIASIRTEIHNSRDLMVDALYPITGRLVSAAVRNAFRELIEALNHRVDRTLSFDLWKARVKAKLTGRSDAEILLEENLLLRINELFLIHRPTGLLIARVSEDAPGDVEADRDLVAGMLTAIMSFVRDAFDDDGESELTSCSFGDSQLYLRTSPAVIMVVRATGTPSAGFENALDASFTGLLDAWGVPLAGFDGTLDQDTAPRLKTDLQNRFDALLEGRQRNFRKRSKKGLAGVVVLAGLLTGWLGYLIYDDYHIAGIENTARTVVAAEAPLRGYNFNIAYDHASARLVVEGLGPSGYTAARLKERLAKALPGTELKVFLAAPLGTFATKAEARMQAMERALDKRVGALDGRLGAIDRQFAAREAARVKAQEVLNWTRQNAIFFSNGITFRAPKIAEGKLKKLAGLLLSHGMKSQLVVIGYSDSSGSAKINQKISQARGEVVAGRLMELGVPRERLITIGRSQEKLLSQEAGPASTSRRVEFEIRSVLPTLPRQ